MVKLYVEGGGDSNILKTACRAGFSNFLTFGQGFNTRSLPAAGDQIESVTKEQIYQALSSATRNCKTKAKYGKGEHSFKLLALISPDRVTAASPWARRFIDVTKEKMGC